MIVYGHRGAAGEAPENTIAGGKHAVARGVRHLEIDLQLSNDGELVVIHDDRLKRTTGVRGRVANYGARELARLDARASGTPWPNKRHTGVPTLTALVKALPEIKHWQLELKGGNRRYNSELVAALLHWLEHNKLPCVVTSSEASLLTAVKQQRPRQPTGFVSMVPDPRHTLRACECDYLIAQWSTALNPWLVRHLHRRGIHISAWTVNDANAIENLYRVGVDSVITDFPSMALPLVAALER